MVKTLKRWLPVTVWMIIIFYLSHQPSIQVSRIDWFDFFEKKSAHIIEYLILTILFFHAYNYRKLETAIRNSLLFAFSDEIHQLFIFGRTGKLRDVFIDFVGILLATILIISRLHQWQKSTPVFHQKKPRQLPKR